jgi:TMEM175 potassium channel family protein
MGKNRLEAFSDGVIAIIITIMVLEMKVPHGEHRDVGAIDPRILELRSELRLPWYLLE